MNGRNALPVLGLAVTLDDIAGTPGLRGFIAERDRDIELRDLAAAGAMQDGRAGALPARVKRDLAGHGGRIGLHAPYEGLTIDNPDSDIRAIVQRRFGEALEVLARIGEATGADGGHMVLHLLHDMELVSARHRMGRQHRYPRTQP
ncbi:MAG: hypothetical protein R3D84_17660 [Paracoccaceae bacterium]